MIMQKEKTIIKKSLKIFLIASFVITARYKTTLGVENRYKYEKQEARFQKSSFHQFQTTLEKTFDGLDQKVDNLDTMNQNLEGRINMLASEKDKLNKAYVQMKTKQSALEKEHTKLKKKTTSLEVAYSKLTHKTKVAKNTKASKPVVKKTSKASKKKMAQKNQANTKLKSTKQKTANKKISVDKKVSLNDTQRVEDTSPVPSYPSVTPRANISEERKAETVSELDIKKINEKGIEYGKKGMYDAAIKEFQKVATVEPGMANIHYNLGLAYKKKGMISESEKAFAEYERLKGQTN